MPRSFDQYRSLFPAFYDAVKKGHGESKRPHRGHGLDHDVAVAQMAALIAPAERTADKAWVASMIHSTDRIVEDGQLAGTLRHLLGHLPKGFFTPAETGEIFEAALKHSELNKDHDSLVLQVLKDADRLVNLNLLVVIRGAQHYPEIPAVEIDQLGDFNPKSTYRHPSNCLDNMRYCLEYIEMLRIEKAKLVGMKYGHLLEKYIQDAEQMFHDLGIAGAKL